MNRSTLLLLALAFLLGGTAVYMALAPGEGAATEARAQAAPTANRQDLTVARVVDGDTYELSDGRRVRLIGIDTPEKHASAKLERDAERSGRDAATIQALGRRASEHASSLVSGRSIRLEYDQANAATGNQDRYGRTLAYVWVLDEAGRDAYCVNERMIADGFASAYTAFPFARAEAYRTLERQAREANRGLWADDALEASEPIATQCRGVTRSGAQCQRTTRDPSGFCPQHRDQAG
jgi:micrococcal nuclease